jgi:hypothetical protein
MSRQLKRFCTACAAPLAGNAHARYCSPACRLDAFRERQRTAADSRRCGHCSIPLEASKRLTARYCGDACRQAARRDGRVPKRKAHQAREHGSHTLEGYTVTPIDNPTAREFILQHEWLGTMPSIPLACYGLRTPSLELVGVTVFGIGSQPMRVEFGREAVAVERGAVLGGEPRNAGSFLLSRAVRLARREHGWRTFIGWADVRAGETGAIYRAAGWKELPSTGGTVRTEYRRPDGEPVSERAARAFAARIGTTVAELVAAGWRRELVPRKRRFARFV